MSVMVALTITKYLRLTITDRGGGKSLRTATTYNIFSCLLFFLAGRKVAQNSIKKLLASSSAFTHHWYPVELQVQNVAHLL